MTGRAGEWGRGCCWQGVVGAGLACRSGYHAVLAVNDALRSLARPVPCVASPGQDPQVTTHVSARARGLAGHHQLRRSSGRGVQAGVPDAPQGRDQAVRAMSASATWEGNQRTAWPAPGVALWVRAERCAGLVRTKQLVVDQRAGLSDEDQRAARDRECDQFHGCYSCHVSDVPPRYGGSGADFNP